MSEAKEEIKFVYTPIKQNSDKPSPLGISLVFVLFIKNEVYYSPRNIGTVTGTKKVVSDSAGSSQPMHHGYLKPYKIGALIEDL